MQKIIHYAETRGHFDYGWLNTRHTFSFSSYHNPERVQFGKLRVLNDDIVMPGEGFGTHPHNNMEIISIPLSGQMAHKDSENNEMVIKPGEIQVMSAGSGMTHSEYNYSQNEILNFLQIWVLPKKINIKPRYDQKYFPEELLKNKIITVVSQTDPNALWINQDAAFSIGNFEKNLTISYKLHDPNHGVYLFIIEGKLNYEGTELNNRDGIGIIGAISLEIDVKDNSRLLLIEVPVT